MHYVMLLVYVRNFSSTSVYYINRWTLIVMSFDHYNDVTWAPWRLKSTSSRLFVNQPFQTDSKESTQALHCRPFLGVIHHRWAVDSCRSSIESMKTTSMETVSTGVLDNCCLNVDFQKVDKHTGGKWLIHDSKRCKDNQLQSLKLPYRISKLSS